MCAIWIVSSCEGKSQTSDTLCFDRAVIQKLLIAGKQKQAQDTLIGILRSDISILQQTIRAYQVKDSTNKEIVSTYQAMTQTMKDQRTVFENEITKLNREVRKWKNKTRWTAIGGVVLTGLVTSLFIFK